MIHLVHFLHIFNWGWQLYRLEFHIYSAWAFYLPAFFLLHMMSHISQSCLPQECPWSRRNPVLSPSLGFYSRRGGHIFPRSIFLCEYRREQRLLLPGRLYASPTPSPQAHASLMSLSDLQARTNNLINQLSWAEWPDHPDMHNEPLHDGSVDLTSYANPLMDLQVHQVRDHTGYTFLLRIMLNLKCPCLCNPPPANPLINPMAFKPHPIAGKKLRSL